MVDALSHIVAEWLRLDPNEKSREKVTQLANGDEEQRRELQSLMEPRIAFGTAGLRAAMAPGFGRMNDVTVLQAAQGIAVYIQRNVSDAQQRGIVIGHDHRHQSQRFAELTVLAFRARGFRIFLLGQVHTPSVPFGIEHLNAACGVMVTASHNPAKDNGYKVYMGNGCQIIPPHDKGMAKSIAENLEPWSWDTESALEGIVKVDLTKQYFDALLALKQPHIPHEGKSLKIVYTAMHGVGLPYATHALKLLGVEPIIVKEQAYPEPDFPTVRFPNPEEKGALDLAIKYGEKFGAKYIIANDPDADRFAAAVKYEGSWIQLGGDEVGSLLACFILEFVSQEKRSKTAVLNSTVSSRQLQQIAREYGVRYEETLTGFKWLGNKARDLEAQGYSVPFAYEEALGYMCGILHDKDGISALFMFTQLLLRLQASGQDLMSELNRISDQTGYYYQKNGYYVVQDPGQFDEIFGRIRGENIPRSIGELPVTFWRDLTTGYDSSTKDHVPTLPTDSHSQMLSAELKFRSSTVRLTVRGSGTEPKIKVYIEGHGDTKESARQGAHITWETLSKTWFSGLSSP